MNDIATNHHAQRAWLRVAETVRVAMQRLQAHPARTVVLVPFAQLMPLARAAWLQGGADRPAGALFVPRFETTQNWARALGALPAGGDDLRLDAAHDLLTAGSLLARAGLGPRRQDFAAVLMRAAWGLARTACAVPPSERPAWGSRLAAQLAAPAQDAALELEAWIGRIALAWAANSSYATDVLFPVEVDLLVVVQGFQPEPLPAALAARDAERTIVLSLPEQTAQGDALEIHRALDAEDEAQQAAACILAHLQAGRAPVALVAQDRLLTRRVRAMLADVGVAIRDETGWTLSTTRAAAGLMALLRASAWNASCDAVLEWAKEAPAFEPQALAELERALRRGGVAQWQRVATDLPLVTAIQSVREGLQSARPLTQWLHSVQQALETCGQWSGLQADIAGQAVTEALRLRAEDASEFEAVARPMSAAAFADWVRQTLESGSFVPPHPGQADLVILPLSQLLGRAFAAVVLPGCDEVHLPASPEPDDLWTPAQRQLLGLPSRDAAAAAGRAAWLYALQSPRLDILWRQSEAGEHVMPGIWLLELLQSQPAEGQDPRTRRPLPVRPVHRPAPRAESLPLPALSASSYEDLRRCPYRFFALRLLGLQEQDELDGTLDKRDFGNWLHMVLKEFHEQLRDDASGDTANPDTLLDAAAERATQALGLSEAEFLPFASAWPRVRDAYLRWHADHAAAGARFAQAELDLQQRLGRWSLRGRVDRIDRLPDGGAMVIDYKTESRGTTEARIKHPAEDVQLAFYAALLPADPVSGAYVSIVESEPTKALAAADLPAWRDRLRQALQQDMDRIAEGAPLPALGAGSACDHCAARGLCRQDFWAPDGAARPEEAA